jgi:hypothetical protein
MGQPRMPPIDDPPLEVGRRTTAWLVLASASTCAAGLAHVVVNRFPALGVDEHRGPLSAEDMIKVIDDSVVDPGTRHTADIIVNTDSRTAQEARSWIRTPRNEVGAGLVAATVSPTCFLVGRRESVLYEVSVNDTHPLDPAIIAPALYQHLITCCALPSDAAELHVWTDLVGPPLTTVIRQARETSPG